MKKKKILSLIMLIALASNVVMSNSIAYANNLVSTSSQSEIKSGWHKIKYGNRYGYVSTKYVR